VCIKPLTECLNTRMILCLKIKFWIELNYGPSIDSRLLLTDFLRSRALYERLVINIQCGTHCSPELLLATNVDVVNF